MIEQKWISQLMLFKELSMKIKVLLALVPLILSASSFAACDDAAKVGRKILHLGDSLTAATPGVPMSWGWPLRRLEASYPAVHPDSRVYAFPGRTLNGSCPGCDNSAAQPYLLFGERYLPNATSPSKIKTIWQYSLENDGHKISEYDGVVVALGANDSVYFADGNEEGNDKFRISTNTFKKEILAALLDWLKPQAGRPVIWILPPFEQFPNTSVQRGVFMSNDPHACYFIKGGEIKETSVEDAIPADRVFCSNLASLDDLPNNTPIPAKLAAIPGLNTIEAIKAAAGSPDAFKEYFATKAEILRRIEAAQDRRLRVRKILLDMEKTYPYLYVASDIDDFVSNRSGGKDSIYAHMPDGTHFDNKGAWYWTLYQSYLSGLLSPPADCRAELSKSRNQKSLRGDTDKAKIGMRRDYKNAIVDFNFDPKWAPKWLIP
jgi:lysophospholipase L1-like esterase